MLISKLCFMQVRVGRDEEEVGHLFPVCCLTGTLAFLDDSPEQRRGAQVSASIGVLVVKRECCRAKGQQEKKQVPLVQRETAALVTD